MLQLFCVAIINHIYLQVIQKQLKHFWCKGVSSSRRIQLGSKFMAIKVDATSLAVGLEDGSIELWERVGKDTYSLSKWSNYPNSIREKNQTP